MNTNTIRARMSFSFKGETYELDALIDLDRCLGEAGEAPNFHLLLAKASGIAPYSYLYEVLESHEIEFSDPTGITAQSCFGGNFGDVFDWPQFEQKLREELDWRVVRAIAERTLSAQDLDGRADIKAALLAAYQAGKANGAG